MNRIDWTAMRTGVGEAWHGTFVTRSGRYFEILVAETNTSTRRWSFEFSEVSEHVLWVTGRALQPASVAGGPRPIGTRRPTGRGEAHQVMAAVQRGLAEFLEIRRPAILSIRGATGRQSQLYLALVHRHAAELAALGYRKGAGASLVEAKPATRPLLTMAG